MARKKALILASLGAAIATLIIGAGGARGRVSFAQDNNASDRDAIREALRRGGLREAAKLKGHYVREFDPHWDIGRFDVEALTKNSAAVVVGIPAKAQATRLASEGQLIYTDYDVIVREVMKGKVAAGDTIKVGLLGGRVRFEDGTSAEVETPMFEHAKVGRTYVFFLYEDGSAAGTYALMGGPQGLVEIDGGNVKSHGRPADPVAVQSRGMRKEAFLREARERSKQWPEPAKCCQ